MISEDGACAIAEAPHLSVLRTLNLRGGKIGARGLKALSGSPWFGHLEKLDLSYCDLDDQSLKPLFRLRASGLRELDFGGNPITAHRLGHLLASPAGSELETLNLHSCVQLGAQGAAVVARTPSSTRLRILNLQNCRIGASGARSLARSPYLSGLRELWIWSGELLRGGTQYDWDAKALLAAALPNTTIIG